MPKSHSPVPPASYKSRDPVDWADHLVGLKSIDAGQMEGMAGGGMKSVLGVLLDRLVEHEIPFGPVGGLALAQHAEARFIEGIYLILAPADLARIPGLIVIDRNEWFAAARSGPLPVDLLFTTNPLFEQVARHHSEILSFQKHRIHCATPSGLLLLKLFALPSLYRQGRIERADLYENDIRMLLRAHPQATEPLLHTLSKHMPASDINALRKILDEITTRLGKPPEFG